MAKKMYYNELEAAEKLGVTATGLDKLIHEDKLRAYQDGAKKMFKADEVEALAGHLKAGTAEIELAPADTSADAVRLSDTDQPPAPGKEDTVITAEGISIFDDEDLEIEAADPMAKTQIAPVLEDQLSSADSVGSGSGLLDLTRESDDTSIGAEILDHIDVEGAIGSSLGAEVVTAEGQFEGAAEGAAAPASLEEIDSLAGLFSGLIIAGSVVMLVLGGVMVATMLGIVPGYLQAMQENLLMVLIVAVVIVGAGALAGFFVGKSAAARQLAMRQAGVAV